MQFLVVLAVAAASVQGIVTDINGSVLPGCTITLTQPSGARATAFSNEKGAYRIAGAELGDATLRFELTGFETSERRIFVSEGANPQPPEEIALDPVEPIVFTCGSFCTDDEPESIWELPLCSEYELDTSLIEALERGDRSALALIRRRYDSATTYDQKHRLAAAGLRRSPDDATYWRELLEHATIAVRFPQVENEYTDAFRMWCAERAVEPDDYWRMTVGAFGHAAEDARSRALLLEALKTHDSGLVLTAIHGLAIQRDERALADIERALDALPDEASWLATHLEPYRSEAADRLALRYMDDGDRQIFEEWRTLPTSR